MGSYDHHINVWDTNTTQLVMDFKMPGKMYRTAMSPLATSHMLIAAGTEDVQVCLCDIASRAFAYTLSGHRGSDSRLRLWDIESGCNTLVNFETVRMQSSKPIRLATSQNSELVFVPCMTAVKGFNMRSGKTSLKFRGHYEHVNCCWFSSQDQELYTGGNDRQILVWSQPRMVSDEDKGPYKDEHSWSD